MNEVDFTDRMLAAGAVVSALARRHEVEHVDVPPDATDDEWEDACQQHDFEISDAAADAIERLFELEAVALASDHRGDPVALMAGVAHYAVEHVVEFALDLARWALFALDDEAYGPWDPNDEGRGHRHVGEWMHRLVVLEVDMYESHRRALAGIHEYDRNGDPVGGFSWCRRCHDWHRLADGCPQSDDE